jgi:hypothetical protein
MQIRLLLQVLLAKDDITHSALANSGNGGDPNSGNSGRDLQLVGSYVQ